MRKPKERIGGVSTLDPWIAGRRVHSEVVSRVLGHKTKRVTRDVVYRSAGAKRVSVPELQDHLLMEKGYLPKYSGLPLEHFLKSRSLSSKEKKAAKQKRRYWEAKVSL